MRYRLSYFNVNFLIDNDQYIAELHAHMCKTREAYNREQELLEQAAKTHSDLRKLEEKRYDAAQNLRHKEEIIKQKDQQIERLNRLLEQHQIHASSEQNLSTLQQVSDQVHLLYSPFLMVTFHNQ